MFLKCNISKERNPRKVWNLKHAKSFRRIGVNRDIILLLKASSAWAVFDGELCRAVWDDQQHATQARDTLTNS